MKTAWAAAHQRQYALVDGPHLLASAKQYTLAAIIDEQPVRVCGIGAVFTEPDRRGHGHARTLVERLLDRAARDGAEMALIFSDVDRAHDAPDGFDRIPMTRLEISVAESPRYGAPMTLVRGGEERDLAAVVAMGRIRARPFRFHLDRDIALVQHAITKRRLLAGLGTPGARELHFFIAEEGITAAAYIVVSVVGREWTIEECGDRDGSGARVGALLQALIAREPIERRPSIRGWLPHGFVPPQVTDRLGNTLDGVDDGALPRIQEGSDAVVWRRGAVLAEPTSSDGRPTSSRVSRRTAPVCAHDVTARQTLVVRRARAPRAARGVGAAQSTDQCEPRLAFGPLDKGRRNLVAHDHDAHDAIVLQQGRDAVAGGLNRGISGPRRGNVGGGATSHRRNQFEHLVTSTGPQGFRSRH